MFRTALKELQLETEKVTINIWYQEKENIDLSNYENWNMVVNKNINQTNGSPKKSNI